MRGDNGIWATTVAWGRNEESGHGSNALLVETNLTIDDRDTVFGRFEVASKTAHDLDLSESLEAFTVSKLQGGYTRYLPAWKGFTPGIGASVSAGFVPASLRDVYGSRVNAGFGLFVTLRPAATAMMLHAGHQMPAAGAEDHSQHAMPAVDHSQHAPSPAASTSKPTAGAAPGSPAGGKPRL